MSTMEIATLKDVMTLGDVLARSGFFQDARGAAQAVVKVLAGRELGFGPIASMTGVHIVKGKPSMSAMLIAAAIKRSGKYDYKVREHTNQVCKLEFFERSGFPAGHQSGAPQWVSLGESSFSVEDAKVARLGGDNWQHYPKNMLFARAISNGAKWYTPDIFGGPVYTPDELGIDVDGETGEVKNLSSVTVEESKGEMPRCDHCGMKAERLTKWKGAKADEDICDVCLSDAQAKAGVRDPDDPALVAEAEELFPDPEKDQLIQECGALIKGALVGKKITQKDVRAMKATYLGAEDADPTKCDKAALADLKTYLVSRFGEAK